MEVKKFTSPVSALIENIHIALVIEPTVPIPTIKNRPLSSMMEGVISSDPSLVYLEKISFIALIETKSILLVNSLSTSSISP